MWPILGGVLQGLGGLGGILGAFGIGDQEVPMQNVNPYTAQAVDQFRNLLGGSDAAMANAFQRSGTAAGQMGGMVGDLEGLRRQMAGIQAPGVNEGFNLYQGRQGQIADQARNLAEMFTQPYRERGEEVAARRADQAARDIMGQFGGQGFSGAAQAAAGQAAGDALSNYEMGLANMFGNIGSGLAGNMLGAERQLSEAAPQQNFANTINNLLNQAGMTQNAASILGSQSGLFGNIGSAYGNRSNQLLGGLAGLSAPQYAEQVTRNPFAEAMQGVGNLGQLFSGFNFGGGGAAPTYSAEQLRRADEGLGGL